MNQNDESISNIKLNEFLVNLKLQLEKLNKKTCEQKAYREGVLGVIERIFKEFNLDNKS